jgi:predicted nucleotidyltransferase
MQQYIQRRNTLLERIIQVLEADSRVVAAWLSGSFGRGVEDAWSDFDLHLAIEDEALEAFLADRFALYRTFGEPLLIQAEMTSMSQPQGVFQLVIYPGPIEVDWNFGPSSIAERPAETKMLFSRHSVPIVVPPPVTAERRLKQAAEVLTFFWAMAPIAVKYAGRGDTRRAVTQIELLTGSFITLWRLVHIPEGPDPLAPAQNRATESELDAILPRVGREIDPHSALEVVRGLCREVAYLHDALSKIGASPPSQLEAEVIALADLAENAIGNGSDEVRRPYR